MTPIPPEPTVARSLVDVLGWALLHSTWQAAGIVAAAALALRLLRSASPRARYGMAYSALLSTLVAPVGSTVLWLAFGALPTWSSALGAMGALAARAGLALVPWIPWIVCAWIVGVGLASVRLAGGWWMLQRMRAAAGPLPAWQERVDGLARRLRVRGAVQLAASAQADVACVLGWVRPVILVPVGALTGLTPRQLDAVVAHELAHVGRRDYLMNLVQAVVEVLLFYHPAVWWLSGRVRLERESCCDDVAVSVSGDALAYGRALLQLERLRRPRALVVAASGGDLLRRVRRLACGAPVGPHSRLTGWTAGGVVAVSLLAMIAAFPAVRAGAGADTATAVFPWPGTLLAGTLFGLLVGMRHALEPDHLITVATLLSSERSSLAAARLGTWWGVGHTVAMMAVGFALTVVRVSLSSAMTRLFEVGVATMLIGFGAKALREGLRQGPAGPSIGHAHLRGVHRHPAAARHVHVGSLTIALRPLAVGIVHGLAGSGALTAIVVASLPSVPSQLAYIAVFGLGSTLAMAVLSGCAGLPLARLARTPGALGTLSAAVGAISMVSGLVWGVPLMRPWLEP